MTDHNDWFDEGSNDFELNKNLVNTNITSNNSMDDLLMMYEAKKENKVEDKNDKIEDTNKETKKETKKEKTKKYTKNNMIKTNKPMRSLVKVPYKQQIINNNDDDGYDDTYDDLMDKYNVY